jgi:LPS sulfotransferase NodH
MTRSTLLAVALAAAGCGGDPPPPATGTKSITWAEYQKMSDQDQADPYTLAHLDDDARARLAEKAKKQKK